MAKEKYIINPGDKFGKLTVIEEVEKSKNGRSQYLCKCDCGNEKIMRKDALLDGRVKSCGCLRRKNK